MTRDMDTHIQNVYEDTEFLISDIPKLITDALTGKLTLPREKLDGQNFSFTVKDDKFVFMGKHVPIWIRNEGGLNRESLIQNFYNKPKICKTFVDVFDVLTFVISKMNKNVVNDIFENGQNIMSSEILSPETENVIQYNTKNISIIGTQSIGAKLSHDMMLKHLQKFDAALKCIEYSGEWGISSIPFIEFKGQENEDTLIKDLIEKFEKTFLRKGLKTLGDLQTKLVFSKIKNVFKNIKNSEIEAMCNRLVYNNTTAYPYTNTNKHWKKFKHILQSRSIFLAVQFFPIELFFRHLGNVCAKSYNFKMSNINLESYATKWKDFIELTKIKLANHEIEGNDSKLGRIQYCLDRLSDKEEFINAEGIVFVFNSKIKKLTTSFTAINRLHSHFSFNNPAKFT